MSMSIEFVAALSALLRSSGSFFPDFPLQGFDVDYYPGRGPVLSFQDWSSSVNDGTVPAFTITIGVPRSAPSEWGMNDPTGSQGRSLDGTDIGAAPSSAFVAPQDHARSLRPRRARPNFVERIRGRLNPIFNGDKGESHGGDTAGLQLSQNLSQAPSGQGHASGYHDMHIGGFPNDLDFHDDHETLMQIKQPSSEPVGPGTHVRFESPAGNGTLSQLRDPLAQSHSQLKAAPFVHKPGKTFATFLTEDQSPPPGKEKESPAGKRIFRRYDL